MQRFNDEEERREYVSLTEAEIADLYHAAYHEAKRCRAFGGDFSDMERHAEEVIESRIAEMCSYD